MANNTQLALDIPIEGQPELSKTVRIDLAYRVWKDANQPDPRQRTLFIKKGSLYFWCQPFSIIWSHSWVYFKILASQAIQRLTVAEDDTIRDQFLELSSWG